MKDLQENLTTLRETAHLLQDLLTLNKKLNSNKPTLDYKKSSFNLELLTLKYKILKVNLELLA